MDKIHLRDMAFHGYHGCLDHEQRDGQTFRVDLTLHLDLRPAGQSDALADTVNYAEVFATLRGIVEDERYDLIERVAERIAQEVLTGYPLVQAIDVTVRKPDAPIVGDFREVAVEISRAR